MGVEVVTGVVVVGVDDVEGAVVGVVRGVVAAEVVPATDLGVDETGTVVALYRYDPSPVSHHRNPLVEGSENSRNGSC